MNFENLVIALMVPFCFTADEICFCVMFGRLGRVSNHSHLASKTSGSIGQAPAFSMLIEMPELRTMIGKQAVSLAGLAPISRQSGKWWGKERIQGEKAFFRRAMYMPALCIIRHNLSSKQKYDQMIKRGKPPKVIIA